MAPGHTYIGHIARFGMMVLRDYWGGGAARALMRGMEAFALMQRIVRIEATVRADNARGRAFYRKHGFIEEGTRVRAAFVEGAWIDDIYIGKIYEHGTA
jgi:RimJ/RimL family protein N-acetyltransferase